MKTAGKISVEGALHDYRFIAVLQSSVRARELGGARAITVAVGYALCTIAFWLFPDAAAAFLLGTLFGWVAHWLRVASADA